jgi:peptidoglycan/xylan/chitin deacetylase (PgdA/CDA1 family)
MHFSAMNHSLEHQAYPPLRVLHFLYHELRPEGSRYSYVLETGEFEKHINLFTRIREQVQEKKAAALWPEVTFDDGHISNFEYALPILLAQGIKARFFITAGWTGTKDGCMGWKELRSLLDAGQLIGAHGWSHTLLTHCGDSELSTELRKAKETLEDRLGVAVDTTSLPGGRYNRRVLAACREAGYAQVYTSIPRAEDFPSGAMVGRLNVRGDMPVALIESLLLDQGSALANLERSYQMKAAAKRLLGDRLYEKVWAVLNRKEDEAAVR